MNTIECDGLAADILINDTWNTCPNTRPEFNYLNEDYLRSLSIDELITTYRGYNQHDIPRRGRLSSTMYKSILI